MPGKRHSVERHAEPARDFHLHHRQRDRIAEPALEHFVDVAVARVVVLVVVAGVTKFLEQMAVDRLHLQRPAFDRIDLLAQMRGVALQQGVVQVRIEIGIFVACDQQRGAEQRHRLVVEPRQRSPIG
jgi:hypothetical protein